MFPNLLKANLLVSVGLFLQGFPSSRQDGGGGSGGASCQAWLCGVSQPPHRETARRRSATTTSHPAFQMTHKLPTYDAMRLSAPKRDELGPR